MSPRPQQPLSHLLFGPLVRLRHRAPLVVLTIGLATLLAACATPPPRAAVLDQELPFDEAVDQATDALAAQTQKLPGFLARVESALGKRGVVLDPMLDAASGQQTQTTQRLERRVSERLGSRFASVQMLPFQSDSLSKAQYVLIGTLQRSQKGRDTAPLAIRLALVDIKTGSVVAQASARATDAGLDHAPLPIYQDSPVLVRDQVIDGYIRTAAMSPGQATDTIWFERIGVATVISEATHLYNAERYQDALAKFRAASGLPGGDQLRTLNGIYLAQMQLGRLDEAETAFGNIVGYGLKHRQLDVKFLFNPGSTDFWSDPRVNRAYGMWLRQIARESVAAKICLVITGHTSRTGPEPVNDALSLQRANSIAQRLSAEAAALAARVKARGVGFRENIIGSGTDNAVDALDRRVEFRIVPC